MEEKKKKTPSTGIILLGAILLAGAIALLLWTFVINPLIHGGWKWLAAVISGAALFGAYSIFNSKKE